MPNNWKTYKLGEIVNSANTGLDAIKRAPIVDEDTGVKCLRIQDVSQQKSFDDWGFCEVTPNNYEKFSLNKDEIIVARTGNTIGVNMFIDKNLKSVFNNGLIRLRINKDLCFPKYVFYNFRNKRFVDYINGIAYGTSTQPNMQINSLLSFEFLAPSIQEQQSIASILSAIDDKIENNLAINKTLEEMAMALYKHWFVDFGPFQDGEFVTSELGMIPKGWEVKSIYDVCEVIYGAPFKSKLFNENANGYPLIRIRDLKTFKPQYYTEENHPNKTIIKAGDVIAGMDAEFDPYFWLGEEGVLNQRLVNFRPKNGYSKIFIYHSVLPWLKFYAGAKVGTTVIHLGKSDIDYFKIKVPNDLNIIKEFNAQAENFLEQIVNNSKENQTLTQLRNTLLPKLISGEVRLKEFREN